MDFCFERAVSFLPPALRTALLRTDELLQRDTFEIRLRADRPVVLFGAFGSVLLQRDGSVSETALDTAQVVVEPGTVNETTSLQIAEILAQHAQITSDNLTIIEAKEDVKK